MTNFCEITVFRACWEIKPQHSRQERICVDSILSGNSNAYEIYKGQSPGGGWSTQGQVTLVLTVITQNLF